MSLKQIFIPITKVDAVKRLVYGIAAVEELDKANEIFDYESSKPHFEAWSVGIQKASGGKSLGNVRAMHGKVAAGRLDQIAFDDTAKQIEVCAKIVDDNEWEKVDAGVYTGFSVGGKYEKKWKDGEAWRYTANPTEISIVDNPCMPSATFSMTKADGTVELRKFAQKENSVITNDAVAAKARELAKAAGGDEDKWVQFIDAAKADLEKAAPAAEVTPNKPSDDLVQVWQAKDGKTFSKKAEAVAHNDELAKGEGPAAALTAVVKELTTAVEKAEIYANADSKQPVKASGELYPTDGDLPAELSALPAQARAIFRQAANDAAKEGKVDTDVMDDAWGKVREGWAQGIDGKWKIRSDYDKAAKADMAKREFSQDERDKAADSGAAMPDGSYPIKNKSDLKNAVQAFGRAKNKPKTKAHIKARAKALGASDELPDNWKLAPAQALQKGLYDVGRLACMIQDLEYMVSCLECEADMEGDDSEVPSKLKGDVANLCSTLKALVEEETSELFDEDEMAEHGDALEAMARTSAMDALAKVLGGKAPKALEKLGMKHSKDDQALLDKAYGCVKMLGAPFKKMYQSASASDLTKAGARHSKDTMMHLDNAHDSLEKAGAKFVAGDSASMLDPAPKKTTATGESGMVTDKAAEGDLAKVTVEKAALEKAIAETVPLIKALQARVEKLEAQPAPRPIELARQSNGSEMKVTVVDKSADDSAAEARVEQMMRDDPGQIATALIKLAQRQPMKMGVNR